MKKWLILILVALFSSPVMAGQPKPRGPSRSLNSRPRISSMKDRGKPNVRVDTRKKANSLSLSRNRPVESIIYEDHYYRPPQPIILIVRVLPTPTPKPEPSPRIVPTSSHVTIFVPSKSSSGSKRFQSTYGGGGGLIIFPEKPKAKIKP